MREVVKSSSEDRTATLDAGRGPKLAGVNDMVWASAISRHRDRFGITRKHGDSVGLDKSVEYEGASGLPLAIAAMTAMHEHLPRDEPIAQRGTCVSRRASKRQPKPRGLWWRMYARHCGRIQHTLLFNCGRLALQMTPSPFADAANPAPRDHPPVAPWRTGPGGVGGPNSPHRGLQYCGCFSSSGSFAILRCG